MSDVACQMHGVNFQINQTKKSLIFREIGIFGLLKEKNPAAFDSSGIKMWLATITFSLFE
jgi:hypothetical protein